MISIKLEAENKNLEGLAIPNVDQLLIKLFEDKSLLFLKVSSNTLIMALQVIQKFAVASRSQCNIDKSSLTLLTEKDVFDPSYWNVEVVNKGQVFRNLGMPLTIDILNTQRFKWVWKKVQRKLKR